MCYNIDRVHMILIWQQKYQFVGGVEHLESKKLLGPKR